MLIDAGVVFLGDSVEVEQHFRRVVEPYMWGEIG